MRSAQISRRPSAPGGVGEMPPQDRGFLLSVVLSGRHLAFTSLASHCVSACLHSLSPGDNRRCAFTARSVAVLAAYR